jgi:hypothetical protein
MMQTSFSFPSTRRPLDPRRVNLGVDANALDLDGSARDQLVGRFRDLVDGRKINVVVAGGVRREIGHPRTPQNVKAAIMPRIFNLRPSLIPDQHAARQKVRAILQGNAKPGAHAADASHLSEAAETGCSYFITHDKRMLKKRTELHAVLPPSLNIVTLEEFLEIFDAYEAGKAM